MSDIRKRKHSNLKDICINDDGTISPEILCQSLFKSAVCPTLIKKYNSACVKANHKEFMILKNVLHTKSLLVFLVFAAAIEKESFVMKEWIHGSRLYETIQRTTYSYVDIYNASTQVLNIWGKWSKKIYDPSAIIDNNASIVQQVNMKAAAVENITLVDQTKSIQEDIIPGKTRQVGKRKKKKGKKNVQSSPRRS